MQIPCHVAWGARVQVKRAKTVTTISKTYTKENRLREVAMRTGVYQVLIPSHVSQLGISCMSVRTCCPIALKLASPRLKFPESTCVKDCPSHLDQMAASSFFIDIICLPLSFSPASSSSTPSGSLGHWSRTVSLGPSRTEAAPAAMLLVSPVGNVVSISCTFQLQASGQITRHL
jgi:hypothetical protein